MNLTLAMLILIQPEYIASFDYIHFLENGISPPENSQYWVASIVQEYIDEFVINIHPDLKSIMNITHSFVIKYTK